MKLAMIIVGMSKMDPKLISACSVRNYILGWKIKIKFY